MLLKLFTINMPLSFFNRSLDPFLGIVVTVAFLIKLGISCVDFIILNSFKTDFLIRSNHMGLGNCSVYTLRVSGLFRLQCFKTASKSSILNGLVTLSLAKFNFKCSRVFLICLPSTLSGWEGLFVSLTFHILLQEVM